MFCIVQIIKGIVSTFCTRLTESDTFQLPINKFFNFRDSPCSNSPANDPFVRFNERNELKMKEKGKRGFQIGPREFIFKNSRIV